MGTESPRVAVVGGGAWGKNLIRNFAALDALEAICDTDRAALERHGRGQPGVRLYERLDDVLASDVRGVVLATPAVTHGALARRALEAGKDVYVEKPLCLGEDEGLALNELAERSGRVLMVGHLLWYHPAVIELKRLVDEGMLGRLQYIHSTRLNLGKLRREENVLWSFAPHDVSVILGLLGELPESVQAQGGNFLHERIADATVSLFRFASGVRAHIFVSWLHPFKEQKLVVVGDQRMAVFDDTAPPEGKLVLYPHSIEWRGNVPTANRAQAAAITVRDEEPLRAECRHFLECMATRARPRTDGREGLAVLRVLNACQEALTLGRSVPVSPTGAPADSPPYFVHPTAVVDDGATIGRGTKIWHFSHVLPETRIGRDCSLGQNVMVGPRAVIGDGCKIQNNVSIYDGVTLEDEVFCGPSMVFTNVVNPRAGISRKHEFLPTLVRRGCTIGANATVLCGTTLGRWSFVGAGAVVTKDVPDHALVIGSPARMVGWMCRCGVRLDEPGLRCSACGGRYRREGDGLALVSVSDAPPSRRAIDTRADEALREA